MTDIKGQIRKHAKERFLVEHPRRKVRKMTPYSDEFLAARAEYKVRWDALWEEGDNCKYLSWSGGYEDGSYEVDTDIAYEDGYEFIESEEEYAARMHDYVEAVVKNRYKQIMDTLAKG